MAERENEIFQCILHRVKKIVAFTDDCLKSTLDHHLGTALNRFALGKVEEEAAVYCRSRERALAKSNGDEGMSRKEALALGRKL